MECRNFPSDWELFGRLHLSVCLRLEDRVQSRGPVGLEIMSWYNLAWKTCAHGWGQGLGLGLREAV